MLFLHLKEVIEQHFQVNLTIPFLDEIIGNLQSRFSEGQETVLIGILLIPPYVVTYKDWEQSVDPFIQYYTDELPWQYRISNVEMLWIDNWEKQWKLLRINI